MIVPSGSSTRARFPGRRQWLLLGFSATLLMVLPLGLKAQGVERELQAVTERLEAARQTQLDLISPRNYQRAAERLAEARERHARGSRVEDVLSQLAEASRSLDEAEGLRAVGDRLLGEALRARATALAEGAPQRVAQVWQRAEAELLEAGRRLESGDPEDAGLSAERAAGLFAEAEREAIRSSILGDARAARDEAAAARASDLAPAAFGKAIELLAEADRVLASDRSRRDEATAVAVSASAAFQRAALLAALTDSVSRRLLSIEQVVGRHEAGVEAMADAIGLEADFSAGTTPVALQVLADIRRLLEERANLGDRLDAEQRQNTVLRARVDTLELRLAQLEAREADVAARLRARERREQRIREVTAIFLEEEGEVVASGDRLILRLTGLTFASGSSEIDPEHYPLLTKVQRVLSEFPEAPATIEGHTDSRGNDASNLALSRRRAFAVREYLLASMPISADRLAAIGYGEQRPVASNDTADGRARNRRIDVVLEIGS
jgi:outer membrane protein OmpA-like peptidoglycan-associated protein